MAQTTDSAGQRATDAATAGDYGLDELKELFRKAKSAREPFTPDWYLNSAFYVGHQWLYWNHGRLDRPSLAKYRETVVDNRIQPIVLSRAARKVKNRPTFSATPFTGKEEDVDAARITEKVMEFDWVYLDLQQKLFQAQLFAEIVCAGFWKVYWDSTVGEKTQVVVDQNGQPVQLNGRLLKAEDIGEEGLPPGMEVKEIATGDVCVDVVSPFHFYPDPLATSMSELEWCIEEKVRSPDYVKQRYGVDLEPDTEVNSGPMEARLSPSLMFGGGGTQAKGVRLYEFWAKPSPTYPQGKRCVWAQDTVLKEEDEPFDTCPYVMFSGLKVPNRFWPTSMVTQLRPLNVDLNTLKSQVAENAARVGNISIMKSRQANVSYCTPMDTLALTKDGYKHYDEIEPGQDETLGFNPFSKSLEWTPIEDKMRFSDAEIMETQHRSWRSLSTPNHRWLAMYRKSKREDFRTTEDLNQDTLVRLAAPSLVEDRSGLTPDQAAALGWMFSEGHMRRRFVSVECAIRQKRYPNELRATLEAADLRFSESVHKTDGCADFCLAVAPVTELLAEAAIQHDGTGLTDLILRFGPEQRRAFINAFELGEGTAQPESRYAYYPGMTPSRPTCVSQNPGPMRDAMKLAYFLEGNYPSEQVYSGSSANRINPLRSHLDCGRLRREVVGRGDVWCVRTPLATWTMLQGSTVSLTGNSGVPGEEILYDSTVSDAVPQAFKPPEMPRYVLEQEQKIIDAMTEISGQREVSNATVPTGVTAASAINLLQEADDTRIGPEIQDMEFALGQAGTKVARLRAKYNSDERLIRIAGEDGNWDIFAFRGAMMGEEPTVECQAGSAMPRSKAAKQAAGLEVLGLMFQYGMVPEQRDLRMFFRDYEVGALDRLFGGLTATERQIQAENQAMTQGNAMPINAFDVDEDHIDGHEEYQRLDRYRQLPPEVQQLIEVHVKAHRERVVQRIDAQMQEQALEQQAGMGQQQQMQLEQETHGAVLKIAEEQAKPQPAGTNGSR